MAICCEFIDVIIPIPNIDRVYPGGFAAYKRELRYSLGGRLWHDEYLFRDGAMSEAGAVRVIDYWKGLGLVPTGMLDGQMAWKDLCVVEHMFGGPTLPCDWLEFNSAEAYVYLKGTPPGPLAGREDF